MEGNARDEAKVFAHTAMLTNGTNVPDFDRLITAAGGEEESIGIERERHNAVPVAMDDVQQD